MFQVVSLKNQSAQNDEAIRAIKGEVSEYRKTVQTLNLEIDSLRGTVSLYCENLLKFDLASRRNIYSVFIRSKS